MAEAQESRPAIPPPEQGEQAAIQRAPAPEAETAELQPMETVEGEAPDSAVEVVEEEEKEEEPVINLPLALAFMTGAIGFLVIFFASFLSGTHVLVALFWGAVGFFSLAVLGFLLDSVLNMLQTASVPVEVTTEPETVEGDGSGDDAQADGQGALGAAVDVTVDDGAEQDQTAPGGTEPASQ